jgi:hypothetical protein
MRGFRLTTILIICALATPAFASQKTSINSLNDFRAAMAKYAPEANYSVARLGGKAVPHFCGQCTTHSDCGVGWKCCGPSDCLECFEVTECPKKKGQ